MKELIKFSEKLISCDCIKLTPINEGRFYCRFFSNGIYLDRMFITNLNLQEELILLSDDDNVISDEGIIRLKEKYKNVDKAAGSKIVDEAVEQPGDE